MPRRPVDYKLNELIMNYNWEAGDLKNKCFWQERMWLAPRSRQDPIASGTRGPWGVNTGIAFIRQGNREIVLIEESSLLIKGGSYREMSLNKIKISGNIQNSEIYKLIMNTHIRKMQYKLLSIMICKWYVWILNNWPYSFNIYFDDLKNGQWIQQTSLIISIQTPSSSLSLIKKYNYWRILGLNVGWDIGVCYIH